MSLTPTTASVLLGATQQFNATVSNATNTAVAWSVNGIPGGDTGVGTISANGLYTAPQTLPGQNPVTVRATSQADPSKSASARVTIASDVAISIAPAAADVELGATRQFSASVTGSGNPSDGVNWSVAGSGCSGAACGTIDASGLFTAPRIRPVPPSVTLTAQSLADSAKRATAAANITSNFSLSVSGPTSVNTGAIAQFTATLTPAPNSNPSTTVSWSASGSGCSGAPCGTISGTGSYTAPPVAPSPNNVLITATPVADPAKAASLAISIQAVLSISVQISPRTSQRAVNHRQTFTVQVTGTLDQNVTWQVNGVPGGDSTFGRICVVNSSPCQAVSVTSAASVDYLAPAAVPAQNPVRVTAISQADPTQSDTAEVTILAHLVVIVIPSNATLSPAATQQFMATVFGTSNQNVFWQVSGTACSGAACGTIDSTGFYTAPPASLVPNTLTITATSADDPSRTGSASVTILTGPHISRLLPASITAGATGRFTLKLVGSGFVPSSPGPGSTILFGSTAKTTFCASASECDTTLVAADVALAGNIPVQIRDPNSSLSNQVDFVVLQASATEDVVLLTPGAPSVSGKDIIVVEPSTAAASASGTDVNLNVVAIGVFSVANNSCVLAASPVRLFRPSAGTAQADICAFSFSGLDPSLAYSVSGPVPSDIGVVAAQPVGLGIIRLTLQVADSTEPGPRSLLVTNPNKDKTAATGALEVK